MRQADARLILGGRITAAAAEKLACILADAEERDAQISFASMSGSRHQPLARNLSPDIWREWWLAELHHIADQQEPIHLEMEDCHGEGGEHDASHFDALLLALQDEAVSHRRIIPIWFDIHQWGGPQGGQVTLHCEEAPFSGTCAIDSIGQAAVEVDPDLANDPNRLSEVALRAWVIVNYPIPPLEILS